jgi:hypothetical protein
MITNHACEGGSVNDLVDEVCDGSWFDRIFERGGRKVLMLKTLFAV